MYFADNIGINKLSINPLCFQYEEVRGMRWQKRWCQWLMPKLKCMQLLPYYYTPAESQAAIFSVPSYKK